MIYVGEIYSLAANNYYGTPGLDFPLNEGSINFYCLHEVARAKYITFSVCVKTKLHLCSLRTYCLQASIYNFPILKDLTNMAVCATRISFGV